MPKCRNSSLHSRSFSFPLFFYVIIVTAWNKSRVRAIKRNTEGKLAAAVEDEIATQENNTRDLLIGFTTVEAMKYVTDIAVSMAAIIGLFYSAIYR